MSRKGSVIILTLLLIPLGSVLGVYVKLRLIARGMEADLRDAGAVVVKRQALEPVLPGSFDQQLAPQLAAVAKLTPRPWKAAWMNTAALQVRTGERPWAQLPPEVLVSVNELRPWYLGVLRATHAERPAQPSERLADVHPDERLGAVQHAARLASYDQLRLVEEGKAGDALRLCVDSIALARDTGAGGPMLDAMVGASVLSIVRYPCGRAIDAATAKEKQVALADLFAIRQGFPTNTDWMRIEAMLTEELACGFASDDELDRLPGGGAWVKESNKQPPSAAPAWQLALVSWPAMKARDARILSAMSLAPGKRDLEIDAAEAAYAAESNEGKPAISFAKLAQRIDRRDLMLDQLQCALELDLGHAETGRWSPPARCQGMFHQEGEAATLSTADPMPIPGAPGQLVLQLHPDG